MYRCLAVFTVLTAFLLAVSTNGAQDKEAQPEPKKEGGVDLEALFKKLDTNGDGKIDPEEFKKLPELYKPAPAAVPAKGKGKGKGLGNLDPDQLKKLLEGIGGGGNLDPDTLKKLFEKIGGGKGGLDLKKLREKFGKADGIQTDLDAIKGLFEQIGGQAGNFDPAQLQDLIQNLIGGAGLDKKQRDKNDK